MVQKITREWMKDQIDFSNGQAAKNRNRYPVQEQATQMELWEYVPCNCNESCSCRKHGCTHHWKLKKGIGFEEFRDGFLRMFVNKNQHKSIIKALNGKGADGLNNRVIEAYPVLRELQQSWFEISAKASEHNKTLFCDDWMQESFRDPWSFSVEGTSIYLAKQYCVLFPDICVPYDTASRVKMIAHMESPGADYAEFLTAIREAFLKCMNEHHLTVPELRRLDAPQGQLPYDPSLISLPRQGIDYGLTYTPAERTISLVLDKCFYQPKLDTVTLSHTGDETAVRKDHPGRTYTTQPLSGKGQTITIHQDPPLRLVLWGELRFKLSNEMIRKILDEFFIEPGRWYLLGASMTDPDPAGLGSFIRKSFPSFTSRHGSAIAAILVHKRLLAFRGRKLIELKKIADREEMEKLLKGEKNA